MTLCVDGQVRATEPRLLAVLSELLRSAPKVITVDQLIETVWKKHDVDSSAVSMAISRLRKALGDGARKLIVTVPQSGYRPAGFRIGVAVALVAGPSTHPRRDDSGASAFEFFSKDMLEAVDVRKVGPQMSLQVTDGLAQASRSASQRFVGLPLIEAAFRLALGEKYAAFSAFADALAQYTAAAALADQVPLPAGAALRAESRYAQARAHVALSRQAEAGLAVELADGLVLASCLQADDSLQLAASRTKAIYLLNCQKYPEALQSARLAVALADRIQADDLVARFAMRRVLAEGLLRTGDYLAAQALINDMMSPPYSVEAVGEVQLARAQSQWARLKFARGQANEAEQPLICARDALTRRFGSDCAKLADIHAELGRVYETQGKYILAKQAYLESHRAFVATVGVDSQGAHQALVNVAMIDLNSDQVALGLQQLEAERPWFVANMGGGPSSPVVQLIDFARARARLDLGQTEGVGALLGGLEPDALRQACFWPYWSLILQAESGHLLMLTEQFESGRRVLEQALKGLQAAQADASEICRYRRVLEQSSLAIR